MTNAPTAVVCDEDFAGPNVLVPPPLLIRGQVLMTDPETIQAGICCALRGYHMRQGVGSGTNRENTIWGNYCVECFLPLWPEPRKEKTQSVQSEEKTNG